MKLAIIFGNYCSVITECNELQELLNKQQCVDSQNDVDHVIDIESAKCETWQQNSFVGRQMLAIAKRYGRMSMVSPTEQCYFVNFGLDGKIIYLVKEMNTVPVIIGIEVK